jgi:hypothetical protein
VHAALAQQTQLMQQQLNAHAQTPEGAQRRRLDEAEAALDAMLAGA